MGVRAQMLGRRSGTTGGILLLITELDSHGGIQSFNRMVIESCVRHTASRGQSLTVVCMGDTFPESLSSLLATGSLSLAGGSKSAFIAAALRHAIRSRPTTVIAGLAHFAPLALIIESLGLADQYVVQLYGTEVWDRLSAHRRLALRRATMLTSITDATAYKAAQANNLGRVPIRLLSPVVDDVWLAAPAVDSAEMGSDRFRLLSVGRLDAAEKRKGIDDVLYALASPALRDEKVEYVVVGDGTDRSRLESLADELRLLSKVTFLGAIDAAALKAEFRRCDVFVMPSTQEGFGIVFLEAMACGRPVVASRFGGVPEVVAHGETGLLVDPGDADGLVRALRALMDDPCLRIRLGEAGRRRVEARFTTSHFRTTSQAILDELDRVAEKGSHSAHEPSR